MAYLACIPQPSILRLGARTTHANVRRYRIRVSLYLRSISTSTETRERSYLTRPTGCHMRIDSRRDCSISVWHFYQTKIYSTHFRERPDVPPPKVPLTTYQRPTSGFISYLPASWIPYAELMRLDKPAGTYYLFFPCLFSTLMAASYTATAPLPVLTTSLCFFAGALIMRGAGCTINDLWDRDLDPRVARTRLRPIARGAVTPFKALTFTGFQLLAGLGVLLQFPPSCLYYGIPSLLLVATYPLAKRVTHYPQFVLGLTFSWGAMMGFPALGVDLTTDTTALQAVASLYASCVSWTVLYDMIYGHMDIKDDVKVGIKSIALRHKNETKLVLSGLAVVQIAYLAVAGLSIGASPVFFIGSCGSAAATLGIMIWNVRLSSVHSCWWWFTNGAWFTGGAIATGMFAEYMLTARSQDTVLVAPEEDTVIAAPVAD